MAVPSSGQLREYADIGVELGVAQTNVSLRGMSQTAGFSTPDAMSEFYGYSSSICNNVTQPLGDSSAVAFYQFDSSTQGTDAFGNYNLSVSSVSFGWSGKFNQSGRYYGSTSYFCKAGWFPFVYQILTAPYSINFWAKNNATGGLNDQRMVQFQDERSTNNHNSLLEIGLNKATGKYVFTSRTNSAASIYSIETGTIVNDVWEMFTVSVASNNTSFYHNGNLVGSSNVSNVFASDLYCDFYIGMGRQGWVPNSFYPFSGYIDQMYVFNRPITASEVSTLYTQIQC